MASFTHGKSSLFQKCYFFHYIHLCLVKICHDQKLHDQIWPKWICHILNSSTIVKGTCREYFKLLSSTVLYIWTAIQSWAVSALHGLNIKSGHLGIQPYLWYWAGTLQTDVHIRRGFQVSVLQICNSCSFRCHLLFKGRWKTQWREQYSEVKHSQYCFCV